METDEVPHRIRMTPGARRVLEAADRLFYERGIHPVGVDLIAAEAGVTKKTLYDRFGSKEQLVVEYLARRDQRWRELLGTHLDAAAGQAPAARILAVFRAARAWAGEHGSRGCSMINAHAEIGDPAHPAYPVITGQKQWMIGLFTRLAREIDEAEADRLAQGLMLLHEGAVVAHGLGVFHDPFGQALDRARELLEHQAAAGPGAPPR